MPALAVNGPGQNGPNNDRLRRMVPIIPIIPRKFERNLKPKASQQSICIAPPVESPGESSRSSQTKSKDVREAIGKLEHEQPETVSAFGTKKTKSEDSQSRSEGKHSGTLVHSFPH